MNGYCKILNPLFEFLNLFGFVLLQSQDVDIVRTTLFEP